MTPAKRAFRKRTGRKHYTVNRRGYRTPNHDWGGPRTLSNGKRIYRAEIRNNTRNTNRKIG